GPAADAVPALVAALKDDQDKDVRKQAADALRRIGPAAADAVPALVAALKDDQDKDVRKQAADALRRIGPAADAVPGHCHVAMRRARAVYALRIFMPPRRPRATWSSPRRVAR